MRAPGNGMKPAPPGARRDQVEESAPTSRCRGRTGSGWRAEWERPCITVPAASSALLTRPIANDLELGNQMAAAGQHLRAAASAQEAFFEAAMYALDVQGWPSDRVYPRQPLSDPVTSPEGPDC